MSPYLSTVYFSEMDIKQTLKYLQAQNTQFQPMFLALAKEQEDLKALMIKDKKKKMKKMVCVLNMGRMFREPAKRALEFITPSNEGDNQEEKAKKESTVWSMMKRRQTMLKNNILLPMANINNWIVSTQWKFREYLVWILKN